MNITQRRLGLLVMGIAIANWVGIATIDARAASIRVAQESTPGAGDFDANVRGVVDPFNTGLTIAGFYQYGVPNAASYNGELNGGPAPSTFISQSFFVSATDGLHYVTFHDVPNDATGGSTRMTTVLVGGAGGSTGFSVEDDPTEGTTISDVAGDRIFDTTHSWAPCCTDGYAIGSLSNGDVLLAEFDEAPTGISRWIAPGPAGTTVLSLEPERRVEFRVVPEPSTALLLIVGCGMMAWRRR